MLDCFKLWHVSLCWTRLGGDSIIKPWLFNLQIFWSNESQKKIGLPSTDLPFLCGWILSFYVPDRLNGCTEIDVGLNRANPGIKIPIKLKFDSISVITAFELAKKKSRRETSSIANKTSIVQIASACVYSFSQLAKNLLAIYLNSILCKYQITKW